MQRKIKMEFTNLSDSNLRFAGNREGLLKLIVLPDYCPGKGDLPVGIVAVYNKGNHEVHSTYLGPDVGCGMVLARFEEPLEDLKYTTYKIAAKLRDVTTELGSLGSGNHFIDVLKAEEIKQDIGIRPGDDLVLIHTGSRLAGQRIYEEDMSGPAYLRAYEHLIEYGKQNRKSILKLVEKCADNSLDFVLESYHNSVDISQEKVVYRKGAVKLLPGEVGVIPSSMAGKALLVRGKDSLRELEYSMCHGTGRKVSRRGAKNMHFDFGKLRERVVIPNLISNWQIRTETPDCYRTIEEILPKIEPYVEVIGTLVPKAYVS